MLDKQLRGLDVCMAAIDVDFDAQDIEWRPCPGHRVGALPEGSAFVYVFRQPATGRCLKVGKAGAKSRARLYQHYNGNAASCLAKSLIAYPEGAGLEEPPEDTAAWIRGNTELSLAIIPGVDVDPALLRFRTHFLEAWLILKLRPVYEKG